MKCKYRNCCKDLPEQNGAGRKRQFCDTKCKRMEQYYRGVDEQKKQKEVKAMEEASKDSQ